MEISLGPCKILFNNNNLGETIKSENVTLKVVSKTEEIKTDESAEVKDEVEIEREITFEATLPLTNSSLSALGINETVTTLLKKGALKITSLDESIVIDLYNASLKAELNFNFKSDKVNTIKIKAKAFKDNLKRDINIFIKGGK